MIKSIYIDYAKKAADTIIKKYAPHELPPEGRFHYHQGVFLSGVMNLFKLTGEKRYYDYTKAYIDNCISDEGIISDFDACMLDDIQPAILLFQLDELEKEPKYLKALATCMTILKNWKTNEVGGFWHKEYHPNEMWLDGLYMAGPLQAEYGVRFNNQGFLKTAYNQAFLMNKHMKTPDGLLYHAWDINCKQPWADKETGLSPEVWARALGWYLVASLDIIEIDTNDTDDKKRLSDIIGGILKSIVKYQDKQGMWYQIADKPEKSDNWLESSGTALFVYSIAKAIRLGILDEDYMDYAKKGFDGCISGAVTVDEDDSLCLDLICPGTNAGIYEMYVDRPKSQNDLHGMGAFLLMCTELCKIEEN